MKERLTRNIGMKIVSIVIAFVIWIIIQGMIDPVTTVTVSDVPVERLNEDVLESAGKLIEVESGDSVKVKVRAKRSIANNLRPSDFSAIADITNKNELNSVPITVSCKTHDDNEVEVISYATADGTSMLHLSLVDLGSQSFAVSIIPTGNVRAGYYVFSGTTSPNLITVTGSDVQIAKIAKIAVLVNVDNAYSNIRQSRTIIAYDKDGNPVVSDNLKFSENTVMVDMTLVPTKEVAIVINTEGTPADGYGFTGIEYAPRSVTVAADPLDLAKIDSIQKTCSIAGAKDDVESEFDLSAVLADQYGSNFKLVNENEKVSVRAIIEPLQTRNINIDTAMIELRNLNEEFECEIEDMRVTIPIVGRRLDVEAVTPAMLKPYLDCSSFTEPGTYYEVVVRAEDIDNIETKIATVNIVLTKKTEN